MLNKRFRRFLRTIQESTGIDHSKTSFGVRIEAREVLYKKWVGKESASVLIERVRESWADYEYLRSFRLL